MGTFVFAFNSSCRVYRPSGTGTRDVRVYCNWFFEYDRDPLADKLIDSFEQEREREITRGVIKNRSHGGRGMEGIGSLVFQETTKGFLQEPRLFFAPAIYDIDCFPTSQRRRQRT